MGCRSASVAVIVCMSLLSSLNSPANTLSFSSSFSSRNFTLPLPCEQNKADEYIFNSDEPLAVGGGLLTAMASLVAEQTDSSVIEQQLGRWGFHRTLTFGANRSGVLGFVALHDDFILVEIRGTVNPEEWIKDSMLIPLPAEHVGFPGKIHSGMLLHYLMVLPAIERLLFQLDPQQTKPLVIAGHSMGGAVGHLVGLHLFNRGYSLLALHTTAAPHLGDETFNQYAESILGGRSLRFSVDLDPTPRLPPDARNAATFSTLLPDRMEHSRGFIQRFVERLDYRSYEGDGWIIPMNGDPLIYYDDGSLAEESFWKTLKNDISGTPPPRYASCMAIPPFSA